MLTSSLIKRGANLTGCFECHLISRLLFIFTSQDPLVHLPEDMVARAYNIFAITFKYAVDILTWEKENELPGLEMM